MVVRMHSIRFAVSAALAAGVLLASVRPARAQDVARIYEQYDRALEAGRHAEAVQAARQLLELARAARNSDAVARCTLKLGLALSLQGKYPEAEPVLRQAVHGFEQLGGPDHEALPSILASLGDAIAQQGRYPEAERVYRRALGIASRLQPPDDVTVAYLHRKIAFTLVSQGKFPEAEKSYRECLRCHERVPGRAVDDHIGCLTDLAGLVKTLDRLAEAEALYKRDLALAEATPEASNPPYGLPPPIASVLTHLSDLYIDASRNDEAEALLERARAILLKTVGPDHPDMATVHGSLGRIALYAGRFAVAEREYLAELAITEKAYGPDHPDLTHALECLALVDVNHGRFAAAEPRLRRALALKEKAQGRDHPETARLAAELGRACAMQGKHDEGERLYQRALAAQEKAYGPEHSAVGQTLYLLANYRATQGKRDECERLCRRALAIFEKAERPGSLSASFARYTLAEAVAAQRRWDEARAVSDRVIADFERTGEAPRYRARALEVRATILWNLGNHDAALADLRRAIEQEELQRVNYAGAERERAEAFASSSSTFETMIEMQSSRGAKTDLGAVFDAMERAHARTLLEEMQMAGTDLDAGRPPAERARLKAREAELKTRVRQLELKLSHVSGPNDPAAGPLAAELTAARNALYEHYRDSRSTSPTYRALLGRGTTLPTLAEVQKGLLRPGDLLLVYFFGDQIGAFLEVTRDSARIWRPGLDAGEAKLLGVDEGPLTADRLRRALLNDKRTGLVQRLADPGAEVPAEALAILADTLIPSGPKKAIADGTVKRLIVVPDGPLALFPFETLLMERGVETKYLLDVGPPVIYAPSAAVLKSLVERPPAASLAGREPVLALGDPAYPAGGGKSDDPARGPLGSRARWALAGGKLPRLPFSGWEAQWVAKAFNDQKIKAVTLTAAAATEAAVRYWSPGRRVLHLACHGLAERDLGNFFGALALSPGARADDPADDGFLTLPEIHALDLKACELAVLSACETNFGPEQKGEGTWALSRGFLVAGARRVVASNWLVDDEAAASLVSVYATVLARAEKEGKAADYAAALRDAKRWARNQDKWKSPYYWATLVLVGPP